MAPGTTACDTMTHLLMGNYREGFFVSCKEYKKLNTKKLDKEFGKYYTKYYR